MKIDLTVAAIPAFIGAMAAEYAWQRAHPVEPGTRAGDYQLADTVASLSMGVGSLAAPYVARRLLDPVTPGVGRHGRTLLAIGAAAAVLTTVGDVVRRRVRDGRAAGPADGARRRPRGAGGAGGDPAGTADPGGRVRRRRSAAPTAGSPSARSRRPR